MPDNQPPSILPARNDPCWCGSGKKYKRCHLLTDNPRPPTPGELDSAVLEAIHANARCHAEGLGPCRGTLVRAHTIPASTLRAIAVNGKVYGYDVRAMQSWTRHGPLVNVDLLGVREASSFPMFCEGHDKEIFSAIEDEAIVPSERQVCLLAFRSLVREQVLRQAVTVVISKLDGREERLLPSEALEIYRRRQRSRDMQAAASRDLALTASAVREIMETRSFSRMRHFTVHFDGVPDVVCAAPMNPFFDFDGRQVQPMDLAHRSAGITFSCLASAGNGVFVVGWLDDDDELAVTWLRSLVTQSDDALPHALLRLMVTSTETACFSPQWWNSLSPDQQLWVRVKATRNSHPSFSLDPDRLREDGQRLVRWRVVRRSTNSPILSAGTSRQSRAE
jgi:hypothetical protein